MNIQSCCRAKCFTQFPNDELKEINNQYWRLGSYSRQRDFVNAHIKTFLCKRQAGNTKKMRSFSSVYHLNNLKVCKQLFMTTLNVGRKLIQTVIQKARNGLDVGKDNRGKNLSNNISEDDLKLVRDHIASFPTLESHYSRASTSKQYLSQEYSQSKMYDLYKEKMESEHPNLTPVKISKYKDIFCTEFNIAIHQPKKDQCKYCAEYQNLNEADKETRKGSHNDHLQRKIEARDEKANDKKLASEDKTFRSYTFDLQAVLYSPCSQASSFFYARKYCTYNLTIYDQASHEGHCYLWHETSGNRGSDEIGSILFMFLKTIPNHVKHVSFFSDSCTGQNRNRYMATILKYAVHVLPLDTIDLKFLEVGHTQMECDNMHSMIERRKKNLSIYSPLEWMNIVLLAKRKNPYKVRTVSFEEFLDLKKLKKDIIKGKFLH